MKYVYMFKSGERYYKVGITNSIAKRLKGLQTSNPSKILVVTTNLVHDAGRLEKSLHRWLSEYKTDGGTEWFMLSDHQALELAIRINNAPNVEMSDFISMQYLADQQQAITKKLDSLIGAASAPQAFDEQEVLSAPGKRRTDDEMYEKALGLVRHEKKASASMLQRHLAIGYAKASRIVDRMEQEGIVGESHGAAARNVLSYDTLRPAVNRARSLIDA